MKKEIRTLLPNKQKGIADSITIQSTLTQIIHQVWQEPDLQKAKTTVLDFLEGSSIHPNSKAKMIYTIKSIVAKSKLDFYLSNALLNFERLGV